MSSATKFTVEVSGKDNANLQFRPASRILRGAWSNGRASKYDQGRELRHLAHEVGDIPGERIVVDLAEKAVGIHDPLVTTDEGKRIAKKLQAFHARNPIGGNREISFREPFLQTKADADTLKDWLYWMRLALDDNKAVLPVGCPELPTLEQIQKMPGKRNLHANAPLVDKESKDAVEPMLYDVPVPAEASKKS